MQCYEARTNNSEIKKGAGGVVGQTKHEAFVTEWELCYHTASIMPKSLDQFLPVRMPSPFVENFERLPYLNAMMPQEGGCVYQ